MKAPEHRLHRPEHRRVDMQGPSETTTRSATTKPIRATSARSRRAQGVPFKPRPQGNSPSSSRWACRAWCSIDLPRQAGDIDPPRLATGRRPGAVGSVSARPRPLDGSLRGSPRAGSLTGLSSGTRPPRDVVPAAPAASWPRLPPPPPPVCSGCSDPASNHAGSNRFGPTPFLRGATRRSGAQGCDEVTGRSKGDLALLILRGNASFELESPCTTRAPPTTALDAGRSSLRAPSRMRIGVWLVAARHKDWARARRHFDTLNRESRSRTPSPLNCRRKPSRADDFDCAVRHAEEAVPQPRPTMSRALNNPRTIYLAAGKPPTPSSTFQHIWRRCSPAPLLLPYGLAWSRPREGGRRPRLAQLDDVGGVAAQAPQPGQIPWTRGSPVAEDDPEFHRYRRPRWRHPGPTP